VKFGHYGFFRIWNRIQQTNRHTVQTRWSIHFAITREQATNWAIGSKLICPPSIRWLTNHNRLFELSDDYRNAWRIAACSPPGLTVSPLASETNQSIVIDVSCILVNYGIAGKNDSHLTKFLNNIERSLPFFSSALRSSNQFWNVSAMNERRRSGLQANFADLIAIDKSLKRSAKGLIFILR